MKKNKESLIINIRMQRKIILISKINKIYEKENFDGNFSRCTYGGYANCTSTNC
jgi:hypothetical protein